MINQNHFKNDLNQNDDLAVNCQLHNGTFILLYADDILLLAPSVTTLEKLLHACENELCWLDMIINTKKSCCLRIGPRNHVSCANITTLSGHSLPWISEMRYLGVFIVRSCKFKCSFEAAKRSFYRSANIITV